MIINIRNTFRWCLHIVGGGWQDKFAYYQNNHLSSEKNGISGSLWQNSLIQTVKFSPFIDKIFLRTFCDAPITFIWFFCRKSFGFSACARAWVSPLWKYVASRQVMKKPYLRFSLTEVADSNSKMLYLHRQDFSSNFLWCADHIYLIFLQGKVFVFQHAPVRVYCEMLLSL